MKVESEKVKLNLMRCGNHIPNLKNTVIIIKGAFYLDRNETQHDATSVGQLLLGIETQQSASFDTRFPCDIARFTICKLCNWVFSNHSPHINQVGYAFRILKNEASHSASSSEESRLSRLHHLTHYFLVIQHDSLSTSFATGFSVIILHKSFRQVTPSEYLKLKPNFSITFSRIQIYINDHVSLLYI